MAEYKRVCNFCQKDFIAQKYNTKTCSNRCANLSHKMKVRQDKENMFNDNEVYKRLLNKILLSVERIEKALELQGIKEKVSNEELLTTEKYCELMNIHKRTLRRMIERKEVEITKQGNKIFINKNQLLLNN
ncbi:MAG: excisionase family DNA-binding protein [Chitinophagales bacterium]|nr:excisionase family DNA-binding protein [Chitinophagales bacterium]